MKGRFMTRALFLLLLLQAVPIPSRADEHAGKVVIGQISLSFYAVTAGIVREVLERLGHTVETVQGSHAQIFPRLGAGEIDALVAAWLPHGHAIYWERYGEQAQALCVLYENARFVWMVPDYVPAAVVAQVDDLTKPEVRSRMNTVIQGTGRDSGNMIDYIHRAGTMRPIAEPRKLLREPNAGTLVASRAWIERAPEKTLRVLRRMHLGMDAVEEMDEQVNRAGTSAQQAAREWVERNQSIVDGWFEQP